MSMVPVLEPAGRSLRTYIFHFVVGDRRREWRVARGV